MDQLLVALDVDRAADASALADTLRGVAGGFKIGSRLFTAVGPLVVEGLVTRGDRVFLDLKFHDIPHTVAGAVAAATRLGVWMLTVHASGGREMMRAARDQAAAEAARLGRPAPLIVAVTVLTSLDPLKVAEMGLGVDLPDHVVRLASLAQAAGLDGVVASPQEIRRIRAACGNLFTIVTPGIRGVSDAAGDQSRTSTAASAMADGADYLVVGRPIIDATNPRAAAERIESDSKAATGR